MYNKVVLVGRIGKDPKVSYTANGMICSTFTIATTEYFTNLAEEKDSRTEWFKIVGYKNTGALIDRYVTKGQLVFIEGKLHINKWGNKEGQQVSIPEVIATKVLFMLPKEKKEPLEDTDSSNQLEEIFAEIDEIPF